MCDVAANNPMPKGPQWSKNMPALVLRYALSGFGDFFPLVTEQSAAQFPNKAV